MKQGFFCLLVLVSMVACKRYTDPDPFTDDRLTNPYCNDPSAVNYNWGFPGKPDNSVCVYPTQLFEGQYIVNDTVWSTTQAPLLVSEFPLTITAIDTVKLQLKGFCDTVIHTARASRFLQFNLDTVVGYGQQYCAGKDTLMVSGSKAFISDTNGFDITYTLFTDTGVVQHRGRATKQ